MLNLHLDAIARRNPELNAIVTFTPELARAQADAADRAAAQGEFLGLLHGLPVAHKDLQRTQGIRTTFGSPLFAGDVPSFDTEIVRRMKAAGCVCVGKTNTPEFGAGSKAFNAVFFGAGDGLIALADGSDTGGSLRNSASFCGVAGLRSTPGLVPGGSTLTVNGPMGRDCGDVGLLLAVLAGLPEVPALERQFKGDAGRVAGRDSGDAI